LYTFAKRHPKVQAAIHEGRAVIVDKAERKLVEAIEAGESWAIALTLKTLGKWRGYIEAKDLTPRGQCRLPQGDGLEDADDDWAAPEARQIHRLLKGRLEGSAGDEDEAAGEDLWERQEALIARQHEQLEAQAAQLEAQAARIRALEAATPPPPADDGDDAEVMAEIQRLSTLAEQLQQRLPGAR
jgi:hypothetical protein